MPAPVEAMRAWSRSPRLAGLLLCLGALASPLCAQSLLYVKNGDKLSLVRRAEDNAPYVLDDGKWVKDVDNAFVLKAADDYLPVMITVKNRYFGRGRRAISDSGPSNALQLDTGRFVFSADFESPFPLDDVFLVLELKANEKDEDGTFYLWGLGHLDAHRVRSVSLDRMVTRKLTGLHCFLHVFVGGEEAFNSRMPADRRAAALDRMVASRVASVRDGDLRPLFGSPPVYPEAVVARVKGRAVVSFRVDAHGNVLDPEVASATDPAFGLAAVDAIRQWRFVPRVRGGVPVESAAQLPFIFDPQS